MLGSNQKKLILFSALVLFSLVGSKAFGQLGWRQDPVLAAMALPDFDWSWQSWFTLAVVGITFVVLIAEILPAHLVMLVGALLMVFAGIISPTDFLEGFSRDIILTLIMLFVVAKALEVNGLLNFLARRMLPGGAGRLRQMASIMLPVSGASALMNNTPIVIMLTSTVRRWALKHDLAPSKFLIPLSYAAIFGGTLTLIGSSTNLVVDSLLRVYADGQGLGFFELGQIGLPVMIAGTLYMLFVGYHTLPSRQDPAETLSSQTGEFISEFICDTDCELIGLSIREAARKFFQDALVIEIERGEAIVDSPGPEERIFEGDRLVFAGEIDNIASLHSIRGLQSTADPHFKLDLDSPHLSEVVVSITSSLIGKTLRQADFRAHYGASVIAVYRQGWRVPGSISDIVLHPGDTLILLSSEVWRGELLGPNDFYSIRSNEPIPRFVPWRATVVVGILALMVALAVCGVPMVYASTVAAGLMVVTGSVKLVETGRAVRWSLLVLIASSFSYGIAMQMTGVATLAGRTILTIFGEHPHALIAGVFIATMLVTEVITNNAAALILFPIAAQAAHLGGYDSVEALKAIAITVTMGANCSFITPIGYQTNTIVYGPGAYRFLDYTKVGLPISFIVLFLVTLLVPQVWPL